MANEEITLESLKTTIEKQNKLIENMITALGNMNYKLTQLVNNLIPRNMPDNPLDYSKRTGGYGL